VASRRSSSQLHLRFSASSQQCNSNLVAEEPCDVGAICHLPPQPKHLIARVATHLPTQEGMAGWIVVVGWLIVDAVPTKWSFSQQAVRSRIGKVYLDRDQRCNHYDSIGSTQLSFLCGIFPLMSLCGKNAEKFASFEHIIGLGLVFKNTGKARRPYSPRNRVKCC